MNTATIRARAASAAGRAVLAGLTATVGAAALGLGGLGDAAMAEASNTGALYGDPTAAAAYWRYQSFDDCGLMAVAMVVGDKTGYEPTEEDIIVAAKNTPSEDHPGSVIESGDPGRRGSGMGIDFPDEVVLLAHYGIKAVYTDKDMAAVTRIPTGLSALEQDLGTGHMVIVAVNAETIWGQPGDRTKPDHAVVVTGIDTRTGVVHLNDSGNPNGRDEKVTINDFTAAWATGGDQMVVTS
jgi:hypothetical protein